MKKCLAPSEMVPGTFAFFHFSGMESQISPVDCCERAKKLFSKSNDFKPKGQHNVLLHPTTTRSGRGAPRSCGDCRRTSSRSRCPCCEASIRRTCSANLHWTQDTKTSSKAPTLRGGFLLSDCSEQNSKSPLFIRDGMGKRSQHYSAGLMWRCE